MLGWTGWRGDKEHLDKDRERETERERRVLQRHKYVSQSVRGRRKELDYVKSVFVLLSMCVCVCVCLSCNQFLKLHIFVSALKDGGIVICSEMYRYFTIKMSLKRNPRSIAVDDRNPCKQAAYVLLGNMFNVSRKTYMRLTHARHHITPCSD